MPPKSFSPLSRTPVHVSQVADQIVSEVQDRAAEEKRAAKKEAKRLQRLADDEKKRRHQAHMMAQEQVAADRLKQRFLLREALAKESPETLNFVHDFLMRLRRASDRLPMRDIAEGVMRSAPNYTGDCKSPIVVGG